MDEMNELGFGFMTRYVMKMSHPTHHTTPTHAPVAAAAARGRRRGHKPPDQHAPEAARAVQEEDEARAVDGREADGVRRAALLLLLGRRGQERLGVRVEQGAAYMEREGQ